MFTIGQTQENVQHVIDYIKNTQGIDLEPTYYSHFYHSPAKNLYIARNVDGSLKIRGFHGMDKTTGNFTSIHHDALLKASINKFLVESDDKALDKYI